MITSLSTWLLSSGLGRLAAAGAVALVAGAVTWPLAHSFGYSAGYAASDLLARAQRSEAEADALRTTAAAHRAAALADAKAAGEARAAAANLQEKIRALTDATPDGACLDAAVSDRVRDLWGAH